MSVIRTSHDLLSKAEVPTSAPSASASRSDYSYLFSDLADKPDAVRFKGTDDEGTLQRLKDFEVAVRRSSRAPLPAMTIALPAAYTYFGQFMNHDISAPIGGLRVNVDSIPPAGIIGTADPAGLQKTERADVATILKHFVNEHAHPLALGSLYADGPSGTPELYEPDRRTFRLGKVVPAACNVFTDQKIPLDNVVHVEEAADILRQDNTPLIADLRNDGNLILSQLHLAFLLVHNKAVEAFAKSNEQTADIFGKARQLVTLHYHWLILNDFLPSLLSKSVLSRPLAQWTPRSIEPNKVPMEFTTAAFRFGHSMVGRAYDFNANFGHAGGIAPHATFFDLFDFTSAGMMGGIGGPNGELPDHWVIDWDRMTRPPRDDLSGGAETLGAEQIDLAISPEMLDSAGNATRVSEHGSIMFRNLLRGFHRRIPFGQRLAEACNVRRLSPDEVRKAIAQSGGAESNQLADEAERLGLLEETPAWLYFLCEAQLLEDGQRVGPTASKIIAETIVGLISQNPGSLMKSAKGWSPKHSPLRNSADQPIDSIRAFLLFAVEKP